MQAGMACKEGILAAIPKADVVVRPLADGGEGTVTALVEGMNGTYEHVDVTGPMGQKVHATYGVLEDDTAVMEMAEASGITLVEGKPDPWKATSLGVGDHVYIKIGALTYAAVKFALQDSQNRVFANLPSYHHGYIESISFTGGKLDGKTINFSPELNTLIGIRGSGKSSILETLRYVFDISPQTDTDYKNGVVKNIMGSTGWLPLSSTDSSDVGCFAVASSITGTLTNQPTWTCKFSVYMIFKKCMI